jgi:hypothetical protein
MPTRSVIIFSRVVEIYGSGGYCGYESSDKPKTNRIIECMRIRSQSNSQRSEEQLTVPKCYLYPPYTTISNTNNPTEQDTTTRRKKKNTVIYIHSNNNYRSQCLLASATRSPSPEIKHSLPPSLPYPRHPANSGLPHVVIECPRGGGGRCPRARIRGVLTRSELARPVGASAFDSMGDRFIHYSTHDVLPRVVLLRRGKGRKRKEI